MTTEEMGERFAWYESRRNLETLGRMCVLRPMDSRRSFLGTLDDGREVRVALPGFFPVPVDCDSLEGYLSWLPAELPRSCVLLVRSGYAAVGLCGLEGIDKAKVIRRYTVRKGQGAAQVKRQRSRPAKSVGSRLRMRETDRFFVDIAAVLSSWRDQVVGCERIYLGATPRTVGEIFSSPVGHVMGRNDPRLLALGLSFGQPSRLVLEKVYRELGFGYWVMR